MSYKKMGYTVEINDTDDLVSLSTRKHTVLWAY